MGAISFFDVTLTGLSGLDRVVSLGVLYYEDERALAAGEGPTASLHLIFNPSRRSEGRSAAAHGYEEQLLVHQDVFSHHMPDILPFFEHGGRIVTHNVALKRRALLREFDLAGSPERRRRFHCTMMEYRRNHAGPSDANSILGQIGLPTHPAPHTALEGAYAALAIYCWQNGLPLSEPGWITEDVPGNLREPPPPVLQSRPDVAPRPAQPSGPQFVSRTDASGRPVERILPQSPALPTAQWLQAQRRVLPIATLMMAVARADGGLQSAEVEPLFLLVNTMLAGLEPSLDEDEVEELVSVLAELNPDPNAIYEACRRIVRDRHMRESVAGWVRQALFADGDPTPPESAVIYEITDAMRRARAHPVLAGE